MHGLVQKLPESHPLRADTAQTRQTLFHLYAVHEKAAEHEHPQWKYPQILEQAYARIAAQVGVPLERARQVAFGQSVGDWPAFPDTVAAMQMLANHYKLFVLSNVDDASFARTCAGPLNGVRWDDIYTAQQIGSYRPHPDNYNYVAARAQQDFGLAKDRIVLVAHGLNIDHASCKALVFQPGVWIVRRGSDMGGDREELEAQGLIELGAVYGTLGEMAKAVEKAFS